MGCKLLECLGAGFRNALCGAEGMSWFAAFTSMWDRSEVGGIGLYHDAAGRGPDGGIENLGGVLEGSDPGEGDEAPEIQDPFGLGERAGEAVEDGLQDACKRFVKGEGIIK